MTTMCKLFLFMYNWFLKYKIFCRFFLVFVLLKHKKEVFSHLIPLFLPVIRTKYPLTHNISCMYRIILNLIVPIFFYARSRNS